MLQTKQSNLAYKNADKIVKDAFQKGSYIGEMVAKNYIKQDTKGFARELDGTLDSLGGLKIQASEEQKTSTLLKLMKMQEGNYGFDATAIIDRDAHRNHRNKMQLADPQGSSIGNYTFQIALMYIIEFGSNLDQVKFALRKYFPDTPSSALETIIDRGSAVYGRLNGADYNQPLPIRNPMNSYNYKYEAVRYSEETKIFPRGMLFNREKGSNNIESGAEGLQQTVAYEMLYGAVRIETSKNLDLADAVLRNGYSYPVGGNNVISSGIPPQNTFVFSESIGTYDSATGIMSPNDNLDVFRELGAMLSGFLPLIRSQRAIREIILHPLVYTAIVQNVYFQTWMRQKFITESRIESQQEVLQFYTISGFENIRFVCDNTSWTTAPTNQLTNSFANNQFIMSGSSTTITNASFNGFIGIDASSQGGTLGGVIISPDILSGGYMSGTSGYGVQVFDMTQIQPESPHLKIIPYATYIVAPWMREEIYNIDFQVTIV